MVKKLPGKRRRLNTSEDYLSSKAINEVFVIRKSGKRQKVLVDSDLDGLHFKRDFVLSPPCFKISDKFLGKRYIPSYTEIFSDISLLKKRRLVHFNIAQISLDYCFTPSVNVPDSSVTLSSVKVAREAAQEKLPQAP